MTQNIICFGETLWDMLPNGKMPGGAPMNVAIHLTCNGYKPLVVSRVGNDDLGGELITFLQSKDISTRCIQVGETHLTGVVKANITDKNEVTYKILEPVAWDYIQYDEQVAELVAASDVFIFGSLSARSTSTRDTLLRYLPKAKLKVFDVNLRPPHYEPELLTSLLHHADIVKMNHQELEEIINWYGITGDEQQQMSFIKKQFNLQLLIVTRGDKGAAVLSEQGYVEHPGFKVEVQDTIGSGDAFLATFLTNYLQNTQMPKALERACLLGAFVATKHGATPAYDPLQVEAHQTEMLHPEQAEAMEGAAERNSSKEANQKGPSGNDNTENQNNLSLKHKQ